MLQALKLNNEKQKKSLFYEENSLVGLTPALKKNRRLFRTVMEHETELIG